MGVGGAFRVNPEVATSLSSGAFSNYFLCPLPERVRLFVPPKHWQRVFWIVQVHFSGFIIRNIAQLTDTLYYWPWIFGSGDELPGHGQRTSRDCSIEGVPRFLFLYVLRHKRATESPRVVVY